MYTYLYNNNIQSEMGRLECKLYIINVWVLPVAELYSDDGVLV